MRIDTPQDIARVQTGIQVAPEAVVTEADAQYSTFDLSHKVATAGKGLLCIPVDIFEVVTGDKLDLSIEAVLRLSPMVLPCLTNIKARFSVFYAPYRVLCNTYNQDPLFWEKRITENPLASWQDSWWRIPSGWLQANEAGIGTLFDYFGYDRAEAMWPLAFTPGANSDIRPSILPYVMYNMMFNEFIRSHNEPLMSVDLANMYKGPVLDRKDYDMFSMISTIPDNLGRLMEWTKVFDFTGFTVDDSISAKNLRIESGVPHKVTIEGYNAAASASMWSQVFNNAFALDGLQLRNAMILSRFFAYLHRRNRSAAEILSAIYGHKVPELIENVQLLMSFTQNILTSEVINTANQQGKLSGHGIGIAGSDSMRYEFSEPGIIMTTLTVYPENVYSTGYDWQWLRPPSLKDLPNPLLAGMGDRPVRNIELCYASSESGPSYVVGYVPRYQESRYVRSKATNKLRRSAPQDLTGYAPSLNFEYFDLLNVARFQEYDKSAFAELFTYVNEPQWVGVIGLRVRCDRKLPFVAPIYTQRFSVV